MPPDPKLRQFNDEEPDYGSNDDMFTVALEHNGFFCGIHGEVTYESYMVAFIDYCNKDTWSLLCIEDILKELGYERDGKLHVYWLMPGKDICEGLVPIKCDAGILKMIAAVDMHKTLCLMIDHRDFLQYFRPDVIFHGPSAGGEGTSGAAAGEGISGAAIQEDLNGIDIQFCEEEDSGDDSDFVDSDYEVDKGDDDLFRDNVDTEANDNNELVVVQDIEDDNALEDEALVLRQEEQAKLLHNFSTFNPEVDIDNPIFKLGMAFADVKEFRSALTAYSIRNRVKVIKTRNESNRVNAKCKDKCPWQIKASKDSRTGAFVIISYTPTHTCVKCWHLKALTAPFLTHKFLDEFRDNMKMDLQAFANKVRREYNMCPDRWKLGRARREALDIIHGDEADQFSQLWDYGQELRRSNPGSRFFLTTNEANVNGQTEHHLATLYWSYDARKRGFLRGCRPLIFIDGCHIKTRYKGRLLTAVGIDPNDCIYPIAMGLVEVECTSSWEWFLTTLRDDLNITNTGPWTIVSDKQKGLIKAVSTVFPDAEHRLCVRHLYQNFQKAGHRGEVLKNNLWAISRSTNYPKYQYQMDKMKMASEEAFSWVDDLVPNTWIKAFFREFVKCDILLNNHSEVFNSYILQAREMPILSMLETIFYKITQRIETKRKEAEKWAGTICPKIKKKVDKFTEWSKGCMVKSTGEGLYLVTSGEFEVDYRVDLLARTCDCKRWQLSGIPCHHATACCRLERIDAETLAHSCYSIDTHNEAYAYSLAPLRGRVFWQKMDGLFVHPPLFTKVMGRPKKNRRKGPEEKEKIGGKVLSKHGVIIHCSICKRAGHNKKGHEKYMQTAQEETEDGHVVIPEDEDFDDPSYIQNIIPQNPNASNDPTHLHSSMVYKMAQEERAHVAPNRSHGPLPQESSFVEAARESLPTGRVTTATARGSLRGIGRSRGGSRSSTAPVVHDGEQVNRGRGRGAGTRRKRQVEGSSSSAAQGHQAGNGSRGVARTRYGRGRGSAYYMLFGDDVHPAIPGLNATAVLDLNGQGEEVPISQNAPNPDDLDLN